MEDNVTNKFVIYLFLEKENSSYQRKFVEYFKHLRADFNEVEIELNIKYLPNFIIESEIEDIPRKKENVYIFWNKFLAGRNIQLVKDFHNSIVMLENKTILVRKVSLSNPVNETLAVNHGFSLMYFDEEKDDITNAEYKLVTNPTLYLITKKQLKLKFYEIKSSQ